MKTTLYEYQYRCRCKYDYCCFSTTAATPVTTTEQTTARTCSPMSWCRCTSNITFNITTCTTSTMIDATTTFQSACLPIGVPSCIVPAATVLRITSHFYDDLTHASNGLVRRRRRPTSYTTTTSTTLSRLMLLLALQAFLRNQHCAIWRSVLARAEAVATAKTPSEQLDDFYRTRLSLAVPEPAA